MAFLLIVITNGEKLDTDQMVFRNIHSCNYYAYWIEHNHKEERQLNISAYCEPVMVPENMKFWD